MTSVTTALDAGFAFEVPRLPGLRDEVVVAIERAVVLGAVAPGQRLVETDIARQMGISKAPVREALRELERLGLVVSYPRRGTFVAEITPTVASEAYSLRAVIEAYAGRLAVERQTDDDLEQMLELLARADAGPTTTDDHLLRRADLDLAFHDRIYRSSGHRQLQDAWSNLRARIRVLLVASGFLRDTHPSADAHRRYQRWHSPIVEALRSRDPDQVEVAIIQHLAAGERGLVKQLAGDTATLRVTAEAIARRPDLAACIGHGSPASPAVGNGRP